MTQRNEPDSAPLRFDAARWLRRLGDTPTTVVHALELAALYDLDAAAETLLSALDVGPSRRYPTCVVGARVPWSLVSWTQGLRRHKPFMAQLAAALALAARANGAAATRVRSLTRLVVPDGTPWWLADDLTRFEALAHFESWAPWCREAQLPTAMFHLPAAKTVLLTGAALGSDRIEGRAWRAPQLVVLGLVGNGLMRVPPAVLGLQTLTRLFLNDNPIAALPEGLAELPHLSLIDLRGTRVSSLPPRWAARAELTVLLDAR